LRPATRLVVLGAGYLGLEVAATASKLGANVVVIEQADALLGGRLSAHMAAHLSALHAASGVQVDVGVQVAGVEALRPGWRVHRADGRFHDADLVLVAVGAVPNVELARAAGAHCDDGIVVDAQCRTSLEHLHAIGDCARAHRIELGRASRVESVSNALAQARIAAAAIAGIALPAARAPTFWSEQFGRRLQVAGLASPNTVDREIMTTTSRGAVVERHAAGALVVVEAIDSPAEFVKATQRIGSPAPVAA
jgi:3-phenylpropionate/trans-cinnamate dioxygenase ferredoxin reductase component